MEDCYSSPSSLFNLGGPEVLSKYEITEGNLILIEIYVGVALLIHNLVNTSI